MFPSPVDYFPIYRRRPSLGEGRTAAFVFIATAPSFARWPHDSIFLGAALGSGQREALSLRLGDDRLHRLMRGSGLH